MKTKHPVFKNASVALQSTIDPPDPTRVLDGYNNLKNGNLIYQIEEEKTLDKKIDDMVNEKLEEEEEFGWEQIQDFSVLSSTEKRQIRELQKYDKYLATGLGAVVSQLRHGIAIGKLIAMSTMFPRFLSVSCIMAAALSLDKEIFLMP